MFLLGVGIEHGGGWMSLDQHLLFDLWNHGVRWRDFEFFIMGS